MSKAAVHHRGRLPLLRPTPRGRFLLSAGLTWVVYALACAFWNYLATGSWFNLSVAAYKADFTQPIALAEVFEHPINALSHPWIVVVGGLLLGVILFVPIITAVLYRLEVSAFMILLVGLIAHAPVLMIILALGSIMAARTGLRSNVSYLAALLGLAPVLPYLVLFAFSGSSSGILLPIQRWVIKAPFAIALLTAIASCATVLGLARLTRYRPGVVWPVATVLVALSITFFYLMIGPAELDYQLITRQMAGPDTIFDPQPRRSWIRQTGAQGLHEDALIHLAETRIDLQKQDLIKRCRRYVTRYPNSPRTWPILWLQAQAQSLQLDRMAFKQGWIQATAVHLAPVAEVPADEARTYQRTKQKFDEVEKAWRQLEPFTSSYQGALVNWRLGELALRRIALMKDAPDEAVLQQVQEANDRLKLGSDAIARVLADFSISRQQHRHAAMLHPAHLPPRDYYRQALFTVNRLLWLVEKNNVATDPGAARALADYLQINAYATPRDELERRLYVLAREHEATSLGDNFKLAVALCEGDAGDRVLQLAVLAREQEVWWQDTQVEAAFELGQLLMQKPELEAIDEITKPEDYFYRVLGGPTNPWHNLAMDRLRILGAKRHKDP